MKKRILACLLALVMLVGLLPATVLAEDVAGPEVYVNAKNGNDSTGNGTVGRPYKTVGKALENIGNNATVYLADGNYSTYAEDKSEQATYCAGKTVTFVGTGAESVNWQIGAKVPDPTLTETEYNGDYSFDGAKSVTFKNLTLMSAEKDYLGFIRIKNTIVEDCTIIGKTFYWGYISSKFVNTKFDAPKAKYGYALWYYPGNEMTFDNCVFHVNAYGNTINVYREGHEGYSEKNKTYGDRVDNPIVLNLNDCKFYAEKPKEETQKPKKEELKQVLNIKEYNDKNLPFYYVVNFSGNTVVDGISVNDWTCSRLFQVQGVEEGYNCNKNAPGTGRKGLTTVNIEGKTVWRNGKMVEHNVDIPGGSYDDGVAEGTANKYTEGYKDNAFDILEATEWAPHDGSYKRTVKRVCKYCGYEETVEETKRDDIDDITAVLLPALQANTDDHYSYLIGYADGTVRPNGKITRAEVATIFFRLLDDDTRAKYWSSENNFSDVSADKWYNNAVSTLSRMGVIGGYADGTFRPDAPISRAEFAKIAVSFTQNNGSAVYNYFTDVKTTDWFAPYVTAAKDAGLIEGYSDGSFKPESKITRAEACAIVNRTLGRKPSKAHMKISDRIDWPDVQTTDWFYEAIMEATNSHTCTMGDRVETWTGKLPQRDWATLETGWANAYTGNGGEVR